MLTGLKPGSYDVEVQASMWPHVWTQEPFVWTIHVDEPWWRTTGLYVTLGIVLLVLLILNFILYNRNTRLRIMRNNEEEDFMRRVRSFASRCEGFATEVLTPTADNQQTVISNMSPEFVDAMLKIVPSINDQKVKKLTMADLSQMTGVARTELYGLLSKHLDGNPRHLVGYIRLQKGRDLLATTKLSVEEIAEQCGFVSANYFISSFYHRYHQTPQNYRKSKSR
jgi:AraC-like DNA-binding protein